jgi:hypothetical protein
MDGIKCKPYVYSLNFKESVIKGVQTAYFDKFSELGERDKAIRCNGHKVKHLDDIAEMYFPDLSKYLVGSGLVMYLTPESGTNIHIDHISNKEQERHICLNFPIVNTDSVTEFYSKPDFEFHYNIDTFYTTGIYKSPPKAIVSFSMDNSAVLFNTSEYHRVLNKSKTETRILLSMSFDKVLSFDDCLSILKELGYAN